MTGKEMIQRVRFETGDTHRAKYSDWQMLVALNAALDDLYQELATFSNTVIIKDTIVNFENGMGELPEDFLAVYQVSRMNRVLKAITKSREVTDDEYFIEGDTIYSLSDWVCLEYKPLAPELSMEDLEDELELPRVLQGTLKRLMVAQITGEDISDIWRDLKATISNRGTNILEAKATWSAKL